MPTSQLGIKEADNLINHFVIVGDMSPSMRPHRSAFVKAFDTLVESLANRSKELDQETRVTVYLFSSTSVCAFYDMDVLRLPSIRDLYDPARGFRTALLDATVRALDDLRVTPQKYGQHAFVMYVLSDGIENDSHLVTVPGFRDKLTGLPDNWTVASLAPDREAVSYLQRVGFPSGNIDIWDTTSASGAIGAFSAVDTSIANFMGQRQRAKETGTTFTSTRNLFSMTPDTLNQTNIAKAGLHEVPSYKYAIFQNTSGIRQEIRPFVEGRFRETGSPQKYRLGSAYYRLNKIEHIQPQKQIVIRDKQSGKVYAGDQARELLGLPSNMTVKVGPQDNPKYDVFVQSTSVNRKLIPKQEVLVMT